MTKEERSLIEAKINELYDLNRDLNEEILLTRHELKEALQENEKLHESCGELSLQVRSKNQLIAKLCNRITALQEDQVNFDQAEKEPFKNRIFVPVSEEELAIIPDLSGKPQSGELVYKLLPNSTPSAKMEKIDGK